MPEPLESYLVKLGFDPDMVSFARFSGALRDASSLVGLQFGGMVKRVVEWQAGFTGALIGAGTAALGFADTVAMSDQSYRLLALHMYTSLPVARELKVALDALGEPLENIMWDPELARRFQQLVKDQQEMTQQLGPDFENQMLKIRDVRFEFSRFGVELKYLTMEVVKMLAEAFGTNIDGLLAKMRQFNSWFITNMPQIARWIADYLKPILIDIKDVLFATGDLVRQLAADFIHLMGYITGDTALQTGAANFKNFALAAREAFDEITRGLLGLIKIEKNLALLFDAALQASTGNFKGALADLHQMAPVNVLSGAPGGVKGDEWLRARSLGQGMGVLGNVAEFLGIKPPGAINAAAGVSDQAFPLALQAGKILGISPALIMSQWAYETGGFMQLGGKNNLAGIKGSSGFANYSSLQDFANAYIKTIQKDFPKAMGSQDINQFVAGLYAGRLGVYSSTATANQYAAGVQRYESKLFPDTPQITINVNVRTDADPDEIARKTAKALSDTQKKRVQRNLTEFALPGTSY